MRTIATLVLIAAACLLVGCAANTTREEARPSNPDEIRTAEYIAHVEANARRRNMDIVWINPPRPRSQR